MKIVRSCRSARTRSKNCKLVKRGGAIYIIDKTNPRFKCRQGKRTR